jgi:glycosyltransferase involved in cell wall biosynthesis
MRIAFVAAGGFDRSGHERVIPSLLWLVERLARRHDVVVYVVRYLHTAERYQLAGATICDLGRPSGFMQQHRALIRAMQDDGPFDVVHGYWPVPAGRIAVSSALHFKIPSIVTFDSGEFVSLPKIDYGLQRRRRDRLAVQLAGRLAARTTVCSHFQRALACRHGLDPEVIPLGVDADLFALRSPIPDGPPYRLLHVASLNPVKDQRTLLKAVARLRQRSVDVTLDIVGEDTLDGALQRFSGELQLESTVRFHGFLSSAQLVPFYSQAHLFVLTSLHEAAGVVLLEAASAGVPIVGSAVGYIADWAPERAVAVSPGNVDELADAIHGLLENPTRRETLAVAAASWARGHDAGHTARRFEALYAEAARR